MVLFVVIQSDRYEGYSEPIVVFDNAADALIRSRALTKKYNSLFEIHQLELNKTNPRTIYTLNE